MQGDSYSNELFNTTLGQRHIKYWNGGSAYPKSILCKDLLSLGDHQRETVERVDLCQTGPSAITFPRPRWAKSTTRICCKLQTFPLDNLWTAVEISYLFENGGQHLIQAWTWSAHKTTSRSSRDQGWEVLWYRMKMDWFSGAFYFITLWTTAGWAMVSLWFRSTAN